MNISVVSNMINTTIMLNMCICIILGLIVSNIMHTWITLLNMCRSYRSIIYSPVRNIPLFQYRIDIVCHCRLRIAFRIVFRNKNLYRFGVALSPS